MNTLLKTMIVAAALTVLAPVSTATEQVKAARRGSSMVLASCAPDTACTVHAANGPVAKRTHRLHSESGPVSAALRSKDGYLWMFGFLWGNS